MKLESLGSFSYHGKIIENKPETLSMDVYCGNDELFLKFEHNNERIFEGWSIFNQDIHRFATRDLLPFFKEYLQEVHGQNEEMSNALSSI
jgi:hypothetical protein